LPKTAKQKEKDQKLAQQNQLEFQQLREHLLRSEEDLLELGSARHQIQRENLNGPRLGTR
jgi:hypothetical protein